MPVMMMMIAAQAHSPIPTPESSPAGSAASTDSDWAHCHNRCCPYPKPSTLKPEFINLQQSTLTCQVCCVHQLHHMLTASRILRDGKHSTQENTAHAQLEKLGNMHNARTPHEPQARWLTPRTGPLYFLGGGGSVLHGHVRQTTMALPTVLRCAFVFVLCDRTHCLILVSSCSTPDVNLCCGGVIDTVQGQGLAHHTLLP
jgi:hypothetical protein